MPIDHQAIADAVAGRLDAAREFLCGLIAIPSLPGQEHKAMRFAAKAFRELGVEVKKVPLSNALRDDEDYSNPVPDIKYDGRFNLRVRLPGKKKGGGKTLLLNSHVDTVPPSQGQENPFTPRVESGVVHGRGACDAKGQVATIYLVCAVLKDLGVKLNGDLIAHLVNEEECGGNGSLAMVRAGEQADACIILEPTTNRIFTSVRGAVWFRLTCEGRAGHSGRAGETISALSLARRAMTRLEKYHDDLLAASRGLPLFDQYENPMPITFGRCHAGDWPATAPSRAVIEGVLGLLPNKTRYQVMDEMRAALAEDADPQLRDRAKLEFMYRHDSHVIDPAHPLVVGLQAACQDWKLPVEVDAMTASCDSWFYHNQLGIPTVVYGPGTLGFAHTNQEQIALDDIAAAARALANFAIRWCGSAAGTGGNSKS